MSLTIATDHYADVTVLHATGRVSSDLSATFRGVLAAAAAESERGYVVLDLAGLDYLGSAGVQGLVRCARVCRDRGGRMVVAALTPPVREAFELARLHYLFGAKPSLTEALAALSVDAAVAYHAALSQAPAPAEAESMVA